MKPRNKILAIAVAAVAGVNVFNASVEQNKPSDLQMENIEALAQGEPLNLYCNCRYNSYFNDCGEYNTAIKCTWDH